MFKILKSNQLNTKLRNLDWLLIFIVLLIGTISLLTIYSIDTGQNNYFEKHTIRFLFSFIFVNSCSINKHKILGWISLFILYFRFNTPHSGRLFWFICTRCQKMAKPRCV